MSSGDPSRALTSFNEASAPGGSLWLAASADASRVAYGGTAVGVVDYGSDTSISMPLERGQRSGKVAISPDGRLLAAHLGQPQEVAVWDVDTRSRLVSLPVPDTVRDLTFVPASQWIAVLTADDLRLVNLDHIDRQRVIDLGRCTGGIVAASPDGSLLAIGASHSTSLCLLETATGILTAVELPFGPADVAFDPTSTHLAIAASYVLRGPQGGEANLITMDLTSGQLTPALAVGGSGILRSLVSVTWLDTRGLLVAVDSTSRVYIVDPAQTGMVTYAGSLSDIGAGINLTRSNIAVDPSRSRLYIGHTGARGFHVVGFGSATDSALQAVDRLRANQDRAEQSLRVQSEDPSHVFAVVRQGSLQDVRDLIVAGLDPNLVDDNGVTLLMAAAESAPYEVVFELLKAGADAGAVDTNGRTPLHFAAESNPDHWVAAEIVRSGGDPDRPDNQGVTPIGLLPADVGLRLLQLRDELRGDSPSPSPEHGNSSGALGDEAVVSPEAGAGAGVRVESTAESADVLPLPTAPTVAPAETQPAVRESVPSPEPVPAKVWIEFTSDPSGLELSVGGISHGRTPVRVELVRGRSVGYRVEGRLPDVHPFEGTITPLADAVHPTYMTRLTAVERSAYVAAQQPPPPPRPAPAAPSPAASPSPATPSQSVSQPSTRLFDSASGRPAPRPSETIRATPRYVVAFLANELEIRDLPCPAAPVPVIVCGITYDGEGMISSMVDALFDIYLQPSSREVRWYRDRDSNSYIGAFRRPEGVYAISIFSNTVSIGYVGP